MAYSTVDEVRQVLLGLAEAEVSVDYTPAGLSDEQIEYEISNADAQIDAVVQSIGYATPLPNPIPPIVHTLSIDIAVALSDMTFRGSREYASDLNPFRLRYRRAELILNNIARGNLSLYADGQGPEPGAGQTIVVNPYPGDILLTEEVFPRGYPDKGADGTAEFAEEPIPYHRSYW